MFSAFSKLTKNPGEAEMVQYKDLIHNFIYFIFLFIQSHLLSSIHKYVPVLLSRGPGQLLQQNIEKNIVFKVSKISTRLSALS